MFSIQTFLLLQDTHRLDALFPLRKVLRSIHNHILDGCKQLPCAPFGHSRKALLLEVRVKISDITFVGREEVDEILDSASLERGGEVVHRLVTEVRAEDEREGRQCLA